MRPAVAILKDLLRLELQSRRDVVALIHQRGSTVTRAMDLSRSMERLTRAMIALPPAIDNLYYLTTLTETSALSLL